MLFSILDLGMNGTHKMWILPTCLVNVATLLCEILALSPLLFMSVMEAISREFRVALPWELLYADDLAVIAETEEELIKRLNEWKDNVESKGISINMNKKLSYRRVTARCVLSSSNLANCHATVQKLLIRQVLTKLMVWSWTFSRRQCVMNNVHSTMTRPSRLPLSQVS